MDRIRDKVQCNPTVKLTKGEMYPFVGIDRITSGNRDIAIADKEVYSGQSCSKFRKGDTIMARITPCLENGKIAQYNLDSEIAMGSTELFVFREIENISDKDYIYYLISTDYVRNNAVNSMTGASGRQRADIKFIGKLKWNFPEYDVQCKIGKILSTYDDLIEKNNRKIEILQDMAEELYKEWFVRFRFPGYKTAKFTDGIPEGWEVKKANEIFDITIGRTPSRAIFNYFTDERENNYSWISISDMRNKMFISETKEYLTQEAINSCNMPMVAPNTVLLSFKLTIGQVVITTEETSTNEAIAHFNTTNKNLREYTYLYLKNFNYDELGNTSAIGNAINSTIVKNMKFVLPEEDLLIKFKDSVGKIVDTILFLTKQNNNLKQQRDLLLPRLMSGKLEVNVKQEV